MQTHVEANNSVGECRNRTSALSRISEGVPRLERTHVAQRLTIPATNDPDSLSLQNAQSPLEHTTMSTEHACMSTLGLFENEAGSLVDPDAALLRANDI